MVAYIGHDTTDLLGMRQADVGIGLNSGTGQTKEESQLVLLDD